MTTIGMSMYKYIYIYTGWWIQPLKNMSSSVGISIPNIWKNPSHVPNQQPVYTSI